MADSKAAKPGPGGREPRDRPVTHQEDRDHNKHNDPGQAGHKPQKHKSPEQEKR